MNNSKEVEPGIDRGAKFVKAYLTLPSEGHLENLNLDIQQTLKRNIIRARHIFRANTLPLPGDDARLKRGVLFDLDNLIEQVLGEGIADKSVIATIAQSLQRDPETFGSTSFAHVHLVVTNEEPEFEFVSAGDLLEKFWYRDQEHQPVDYLESIEVVVEERRYLDAGEEVPHDLRETMFPSIPTKPRRQK